MFDAAVQLPSDVVQRWMFQVVEVLPVVPTEIRLLVIVQFVTPSGTSARATWTPDATDPGKNH
jgi:hypothetical protein